MKDKTVELQSGRKVNIKVMSLDDIDFCKDIIIIRYFPDDTFSTTGLSKAKTAWLRRGISGGDFKDFEIDANSGFVSDNVLRQLNDEEGIELFKLIREYQEVGEN